MTQNTLATHVQKSQDALKALLKKLIGTEVPLEAASPERLPEDRTDALRNEATEHFCLEAAEHDVLVALTPDWVPVLSEAMLGERMAPGAEGVADLMQEVASQGFGTVQSTLAAEGTEIPSIQLEAVEPEQPPASPDGSAWHVEFSARHEGSSLEGFLLMATEEAPAAGEPSGQKTSFAQRKDDASSAGQQGGSQPGAQADQGSNVDVAPASFNDLGEEDIGDGEEVNSFGLLAEVNLEVRVELGRRELPLADVLKLTTGSVVELEKMVGEPLSVYANGRLIAEGEAVVIDEQFGVRITNLASEDTRDKAFF